MLKKFGAALAVGTLALSVTTPANAAVTVLDFEGLANGAAVGNFYAGLGYVFSSDAIAVIDSDAGGSGNFGNEPSPNTTMAFTNSSSAILDVAAGFTTGFSFFYSSSTAATVNVYDGLGGTGTLLGSIVLAPQFNLNCTGDPTGAFCNWTNVGVTFNGTAKSIDFSGTANQIGFDNITFGSATAGGVPEPSTWAMMLVGFGLTGVAMRRRRKVTFAIA